MATTSDAPALPCVELLETDGVPLDSTWQRDEINLLVEQVRYHHRDRQDYFVGGNMFIYFNLQQARNRDFRGPDFLYVRDVRYDPLRPYYVVWEEDGRYPNVIIELISPSTADEDRTTKKAVYERVFRTPEYFCYDPDEERLEGWRLAEDSYQPIIPDGRGWLWSNQLQLWLGKWHGEYQNCTATWLRFYDAEGNVVPLFAEAERQRAEAERQRAEAERQRAEAERQRAEKLQDELEQLRASLKQQGGNGGTP